MDVVSLYVDQVRESDLSRHRGPPISLHEDLSHHRGNLDAGWRQSGGRRRPADRRARDLPSQREGADPCIRATSSSGRSWTSSGQAAVARPVFNDKHLSWKWEWAEEMVETARELDFALMAGSSIPVAWRLPPLEIPSDAEVEEAMVIGARRRSRQLRLSRVRGDAVHGRAAAGRGDRGGGAARGPRPPGMGGATGGILGPGRLGS